MTALHVSQQLNQDSEFLTYLAEKQQLGDEDIGPVNCRVHGLGERINRAEAE